MPGPDAEEGYRAYSGDYPEETKADDNRVGSKLPITSQQKALSELHDVISQLTGRLKPVLTPVPESDSKPSEDRAMPVQSPLAELISENTEDVRRASRKLRALMERLEC